ncbi:hypothetical protein Tco_1392096 [Tanacetum coccineum]
MAMCHHLSGATWHDNYFGTVTRATARPPVNGCQRRSTVTDHRGPPPEQWSGWVNGRIGSGQRLPRGSHVVSTCHHVAADVAEGI